MDTLIVDVLAMSVICVVVILIVRFTITSNRVE